MSRVRNYRSVRPSNKFLLQARVETIKRNCLMCDTLAHG